jgi:hydrogenase maturation protease
MPARVVVIGAGNIFARDDGVGPRVVERLSARPLPPGVECVDAGTDLLGVLPGVEGADRLVLVDALRAGGAPGTIHRMTLEAIEDRARQPPMQFSMHEMSLVESVRLARLAGLRLPPTIVIGVEPGEVGLGADLTPAVAASMEAAMAAVLQEVEGGKRDHE